MPIYDYVCTKCGNKFEHYQHTSKPLKKCKKCNGTLKRLIGSGIGLKFNGKGFYKTDYKE